MKNEFKTLGMLALEDKKEIWLHRMSGSQVKRVSSDAQNLFLEKTGAQEIVDLSKTKAKRYLDMGNTMEPIIIDMANKAEVLGDIKTDKDTFESTTDKYFTANIDGYIGDDINHIETIVEVKNTIDDSTESIIDKYLNQVDYYMWFFDAKDAVILAFIKGNELRPIRIVRDADRELMMLNKIATFRQNVELGMEPAVVEVNGKTKTESPDDEDSLAVRWLDAKLKLEKYKKLSEKLGIELKAEDKGFAKSTYNYGRYTITKTNGIKKGMMDNKKLFAALLEDAGVKDTIGYMEQFRKAPTKTETLRIKEVK